MYNYLIVFVVEHVGAEEWVLFLIFDIEMYWIEICMGIGEMSRFLSYITVTDEKLVEWDIKNDFLLR